MLRKIQAKALPTDERIEDLTQSALGLIVDEDEGEYYDESGEQLNPMMRYVDALREQGFTDMELRRNLQFFYNNAPAIFLLKADYREHGDKQYLRARVLEMIRKVPEPLPIDRDQFISYMQERYGRMVGPWYKPSSVKLQYGLVYDIIRTTFRDVREDYAELCIQTRDIVENYDMAIAYHRELEIFRRCFEEDQPIPAYLLDLILRLLDNISVCSFAKYCAGGEREGLVEVTFPFTFDPESKTFADVELSEKILTEGNMIDVLPMLGEDKVDCKCPSYVLDEEKAVFHYSRYMEITRNDGVDTYTLPEGMSKAFVSLTPTNYDGRGVRLGVDLLRIKIPEKIEKLYRSFGCGPGVTFLMDPRFRNTFMRYLTWHGLLDVRHLGLSPRIEVKKLIYDSELKIDMSLTRAFNIISTGRGDPSLPEHLGLQGMVSEFETFVKRQVNKQKPTKVLSAYLQKHDFVSHSILTEHFIDVYKIGKEVAQRYVLLGMCPLAGQLEFDREFKLVTWRK